MIVITTGQDYKGNGGKVASGKKTATTTSANIYIDGSYVQLEGYSINGSNYFKLRDIAEFVDAEVAWNNATKSVDIITDDVPKKPAGNAVMQAYVAFLGNSSVREHKFVDGNWVENVELNPDYFYVKDLTEDGQPELMVGTKHNQDKAFPGCVKNFVIYTYNGGKVVALDGENLESWTPYIYLLDGRIVTTFQTGSGGMYLYNYRDFVKNTVKSDDEFKNYIGCGNVMEMDKVHLDASAKLSEVKFIPNTASNRAMYLK